MDKIINKVQNELHALVEKEVFKTLSNKAIPTTIDMLMDEFDLNVPEPGYKSKINIESIRSAYEEALNGGFVFLDVEGDSVTFRTPDMDNFDFSNNKLQVLLTMLEGIAGRYLIVDGDEFKKMFPKDTLKKEAFGEVSNELASKDKLYLIKDTSRNRKMAKDLKLILEKWPYSTPIQIFDDVNKKIDKEILPRLLSEAVTNAIKTYTRRQQGAKV